MATQLSAQDPFISEVYFYSGSTNEQEAIEIAGPTGNSLEGWQLLLYDGATGMVYDSHIFGADVIFPYTVTLEEQDYGTIVQYYGVNGIQDGLVDGDGLALVNPSGLVTEFWSYGGTFLAVDGPAVGQMSQNIGSSTAVVSSNGLFSFNRRCIPPFDQICGPNDLPYIPGLKELTKLEYWLEVLGAYRKPVICGTYVKGNQAEGNPEDLYYDRFGNSYSKQEVNSSFHSNTHVVPCSYFDLMFDDNFTNEEEATICAVFTYLSEEIINVNPPNFQINILIEKEDFDNDDGTPDNGTIATGSSNWSSRCGIGNSLLLSSLIGRENNAGIDHGLLRINSRFTNFHTIDMDDSCSPDFNKKMGSVV